MRLNSVLFGLILTLVAGSLSAAERLQAPFDVEGTRAARGAMPKKFTCAAAPAPVRDLTFDGFYQQGTNSSVVDEAKMKAYDAATKTLDAFEMGVQRLGDSYVAAKPAEPAIAACALDWMAGWAGADALMGKISQQGSYVRKWMLATTAIAYIKIRDDAGLDAAKKQAVEGWMRRWSDAVRADYSTRLDRSDKRNNHSYWAGWAVIAAAVALNDRSHFDWALGQFRKALDQIKPDGTLPLEMERRQRALHYHLYAVAPLVMIAETAARNGVNLYDEKNGAFHRLVQRTVEGFDDQSFFEKASGSKQEFKNKPNAGDIVWALPYKHRYPAPALDRWTGKFDRLYSTRTGGDFGLLFGK
jgi:poly(beta-D-mannuronate) lyase